MNFINNYNNINYATKKQQDSAARARCRLQSTLCRTKVLGTVPAQLEVGMSFGQSFLTSLFAPCGTEICRVVSAACLMGCLQ